jgi:hypothetical protein
MQAILRHRSQGLSPGVLVLVVVTGVLLAFFVGNYFLFNYYQKVAPPRKKKPLSKKKLEREKRKQGVNMSGEA